MKERIEVRRSSLEGVADVAPPSTATRTWERWALRFTSPVAVMLSVPLSTLAVGVALVGLSYQRMVALDEQSALERAEARRAQAELGIRRTLANADALLDRLRELALHTRADAEMKPLAFTLADLALRRTGLAWLSLSFPDGTFAGVFRELDGTLCFQRSKQLGQATSMDQFYLRDGALVPKAHAEFHYDPRERGFYREALAQRRRLWTEPYTFYPDFRTGITRAEAVFDERGALLAVVTADYDVSDLSGILSEVSQPDESQVLFTDAGVVLGVSGLRKDPRPRADERPLTFADLGRTEMQAFFGNRKASSRAGLEEFSVGGETWLGIEQQLRGVPGLDWRLATIVPQRALLTTARAHARSELWLAGAVVLLGAGLATALSIGIRRLRRARRLAEARVEHAVGMLNELGAYTLEEPLGSGGMGEVFRAKHRMLARPAAIKLIRSDLPREEREHLEQRFEREAKLLSQLRSPHTVTILDYGRTTDDRLFIAMELLIGLPLDRLIERYGAQPPARVIPILLGVCRSLSEAHAAGIVHRDIKPANLFLCHDAEGVELVKVLDFGLAKNLQRSGMSTAGHIAGTPHFMAPEQATGGDVDGRTDLYALGCTAFYLLTGTTVFDETQELAVVLAHQQKQPPALGDRTKQWLPAGLEPLIQRCLAKDPAFRPVSAAALGRALLALELPEEQRMSAEVWRDWWKRISETPSTHIT
ncbi:MAG: serine/threonine protein kinase [Polyangiaceae bacterium]